MSNVEFNQIMTALRGMRCTIHDDINEKLISYEGVYNILRSHVEDGPLSCYPQDEE